MGMIIFFAGVVLAVGGVGLLVYQGIQYLMHESWTMYSVLSLIDLGPEALQDSVYSSPGLSDALESCPLFLALVIIGLILSFAGSRFSNRYTT